MKHARPGRTAGHAVLFGVLAITLVGCENSDNPTSTQPSAFATYQPTSGQNLAPGIAPYARGDPNWPMDAAQGGGGGNRR